MKQFARFLLTIILLGGSGCSRGPTQEIVLARYDFANSLAEFAYGRLYGSDRARHWFASGWARLPNEKGVWAVGPSSEILLYLVGRDCRLTFVLSTSDDLVAAGQDVTLAVNGNDLGSVHFTRAWDQVVLEASIPDDILTQGFNRITLTPAGHRPERDGPVDEDTRPLSFWLHSLLAVGRLDRAQLRTWQGLDTGPIPPRDWQVMDLPALNEETDQNEHDAAPSSSLTRKSMRGQPPDILVFLLDAARPDHFGCYGYERNTTPAIDALAADGLVFTNVLSTAAYTRCAVPSLLTGFSWRDHRVIYGSTGEDHGDALSDSFLTLPELLRASGYRTLAYSSNPNFSVATNTHQGFDEFTEVWKTTEGKPNEPEWTATLFDRRLAAGLDDGPVLCYFHMQPPHEPYQPGDKHDLWPVPGHDLKIDGSLASINRLDRAQCRFAKTNRDRLVSLYDGNLHRADAVVDQILTAWRKLRRGRPYLSVVLSDHGEAFGEHCRFSHNTTVHDEMTRIPLIMSPREACQSLAPAAENLLAITDVMPMLLHVTGIKPPPDGVWPRRFLRVMQDPTAPRAAVVLRSTVNLGRVGLRTGQYLAFWNGWSQQELYDLESDPQASTDLRRDEPGLYLSLMASLQAILAGSSDDVIAGKAELSEEDRQTLKSLGYL